MQKVTEKTVCDRCGAVCDHITPSYSRGKVFIGQHLYKWFGHRCDEFGKHTVKVYWDWHDPYNGGQNTAVVDLCRPCQESLKAWLINGRDKEE